MPPLLESVDINELEDNINNIEHMSQDIENEEQTSAIGEDFFACPEQSV